MSAPSVGGPLVGGPSVWSMVAGASTYGASAAGGAARSAAQSSQSSAEAATGLDKNAFMRLLLTQMQSQDPMSPMDGQAFFTQLAQLSLVEQMYELNETLASTQRQQQLVQAGTLIGRSVEYVGPDGGTVAGTVQGARMVDGEVLLDVDGIAVPMALVSSVRAQEATPEPAPDEGEPADGANEPAAPEPVK